MRDKTLPLPQHFLAKKPRKREIPSRVPPSFGQGGGRAERPERPALIREALGGADARLLNKKYKYFKRKSRRKLKLRSLRVAERPPPTLAPRVLNGPGVA